MKNIKFLLFIICLLFYLNVIFFNCSFATLYIVKDQEGNNICMTNKEDLVSGNLEGQVLKYNKSYIIFAA